MVGKIKHVRQKLHQEAVKLDTPSSLKTPAPPAPSPAPPAPIAAELHNTTPNTKSDTSKHVKQVLGAGIFQSGIFAGTNITPEALVQTLKFEDPPDVPIPAKKVPEEKKVKPKKEKMKERRERWLNKISSIKQAKEQQAAEWGGTSLGPPDPGPNGETYEDFDSRVIEVKSVFNMTAKEGRKRSISCLVAVGNGNGAAGFALGKAADRRTALRKAKNRAINYLHFIERYNNKTIYHDIESKCKKTMLHMKKQPEGYGLHCHRAVITLCKLIGIQDMYCKLEGSANLLNITRALFTGLAKQEVHQNLAEKKKLHVVEFDSRRGPLPVVVATPKDGARPNPEREDDIPNTRLHWDNVRAAQGTKRSIWAHVKHTIW